MQALARFIAQHGIAAEIVPMTVETPTVPAAAAALGVSPAQIIKSLLFMVRDQPVLVIASGETMVDRGILAARFGVGKKQIKLADAETVLRLTGYPAGGVPPFGHPGAAAHAAGPRACWPGTPSTAAAGMIARCCASRRGSWRG